MKKVWKIYLWSWVVYFAIPICGLIASLESVSDSEKYMNNFSDTPENIEKIINIDLPDIVHVKPDNSSGNYWTTYGYELKFSEELSEDCIRELNMRYKTDNAHWSTNSGAFIYRESASSYYELCCLIYKDHSVVEYGYTDELSNSELALLAFIAGGFWILIFMGVILGVIGAICERRREKKQANSSTQS
jgi:hypothetical protein